MCFFGGGSRAAAPLPTPPSVTSSSVQAAGASAVKAAKPQQTVFTSPTGISSANINASLFSPILGGGGSLGNTRPNSGIEIANLFGGSRQNNRNQIFNLSG